MYDKQKIFDDVVLGQYKLSPKFAAVLQQIIDAHNISTDIATIHSVCFDLDTAVGVWLDLLGKKIGLSRILKVPAENNEYFGFNEDSDSEGFDCECFYQKSFDDYSMNDTQYRAALKLKAEANYLNANVQNINYLMRKYFERQDCNVQFHGVMNMAFWILFAIDDWQKALLPLIFPIPAAVSWEVIDHNDYFGFDDDAEGFDCESFI